VKTSFCTARPYAKAALDAVQWGKRSPWQFVNPFRSVFVDRPKKSAVPNSGRTHYVGDNCPGGHGDVPAANNDNNVTGPTS
jgi:hypothetical protein